MNQNSNKEKNYMAIPTIAVRGFVIFPGTTLHFDVGRTKSIEAVKAAMELDQRIFLVSQKDMMVEDPSEKDIYKVGIVATIKQIIKMPDKTVKVVIEGGYRAKLSSVISTDPFLVCQVAAFPLRVARKSDKCLALMRTVKELFDEYAAMMPKMPKEVVLGISTCDDPVELVEDIIGNIMVSTEIKQKILECSSPLKRLELMVGILDDENNLLSMEQSILTQVKEQMDKNQREYFLREQMKVISSELGEDQNEMEEIDEYHEKIEKLKACDEVKNKLDKEVDRLAKMPYNSQEAAVLRGYLDRCLELPFGVYTKESTDIERARKILNRDHYGMQKVKDRVLEMIAVRKINPESPPQIICLVGPPGVGKTSVARSIAAALNRSYARMALGGIRDESDIRGHRKTYVGSMPGRIMETIVRAGTSNPLLLLDEIDKMSSDFKGDPSAAMLEVLDAEQNFEFRDHYLEIPFDLSKVLFITTANRTDTIPAPLLDRMEVIELPSYTRDEKLHIAKQYLVPKQLKKHGISKKQLKITDSALLSIIDLYTRESGVRNLEREIGAIVRKTALLLVESGQENPVFRVTDKNITDFLGNKKIIPDALLDRDEVGTVNGLAWTSVGGELLPIEVSTMPGTGKILLTGNLGDVMKESAQAALSFVRSIAQDNGIDPDFYKNTDIHIHAPEGAVPKDGPSAGTALATAIFSSLTGRTIKRDVAMTGEITLRGRVLAIGGLREKTMAAHRAGIKTVIIPQDNIPDLSEIDSAVKEALRFVPVRYATEVLKVAVNEKKDGEETHSKTIIPATAEELNNLHYTTC